MSNDPSAALQDAVERAGQILEHLYFGSMSERLLMASELGILTWKRERHAARKALEDAAEKADEELRENYGWWWADWLRARAKLYDEQPPRNAGGV